MTDNISAPMKDPTTYLDYPEAVKLEEAAFPPRNRLIVSLLFRCGLRANEVVKLRKKDVLIDPQAPAESVLIVLSKGKKERKVRQRVFIDAQVQPLLSKYIESLGPDDFIFPSYSESGHLSTRYVQKIIENTGKKCGVMLDKGGNPIHPHTLRHSLAIFLVKSGVGISKIQQILRHKSLSSTSYYLTFSQKEVAQDYHRAFEKVSL